jgi:hypothetical protein
MKFLLLFSLLNSSALIESNLEKNTKTYTCEVVVQVNGVTVKRIGKSERSYRDACDNAFQQIYP